MAHLDSPASLRRAVARVLLGVLLAGCALDPPPEAEPAPAPAPAASEPARPLVAPVRLQVPIELRRRLPLVEVTIGGKGPFRFVVDTGAGADVVMDLRLARRLGLSLTGGASLLAQGKLIGSKTARIPEVRIGDVSFGPRGGIVQDMAGFRRILGDDYGGVLGFPLFRGWQLTLDYPARRLELAEPGYLFEDGETVLPYQLVDNTPLLTVGLGRYQVALTVDSGASFPVLLPARLAPQLQLIGGMQRGPESLGVGGAERHGASRLDGELTIGRHCLERPTIVFGRSRIGLLGSGVLRRFRVSFDTQRRMMQLEAPADEAP